MRKELAVFALGCTLSGAIVFCSLSRSPEDPQESAETPQEQARACPWWLTFEEEPRGCPAAVSASLVWLAAQHHDDGSWGSGTAELEGRRLGKTGLTALALLPFLGAGYTPLSKDRYVFEGGEWCFGEEIRKALDWLDRDQREDGTFRSVGDETLDLVLATFALCEVYGQTAAPARKLPAQLAVDALLRLQKPEGSWEGAGPTAWAIVTLYAARASELNVDASAIDRALKSPRYPGHPGDALARILLKSEAKEAAWGLRQESRERDPGNVAWWYLATVAMWARDGPRGTHRYDYAPGPEWIAWSPIVREKLVPLMAKDGSFPGRSLSDKIVRTSLAQLTLEVYYQYTNVFRPR